MWRAAEDIEKRADLGLGAAPAVGHLRAFHEPKVAEAGLNGRERIRFLEQVAGADSHLNSCEALMGGIKNQ